MGKVVVEFKGRPNLTREITPGKVARSRGVTDKPRGRPQQKLTQPEHTPRFYAHCHRMGRK